MNDSEALAHDRSLYAFEGETNYPLHPDPVVRDTAAKSFEMAFHMGWMAGQTQALRDQAARFREAWESWGKIGDILQAEAIERWIADIESGVGTEGVDGVPTPE